MLVVLVGGPCSGKDEVAKRLEKHSGFFVPAPGANFREAHAPGSRMHTLVQPCLSYVKAGEIVPDELFFPVWREYAKDLVGKQRLLFNGFPRTRKQAEHFVSTLDIIAKGKLVVLLQLVVSRETALKRMSVRGREDDVSPEVRWEQFETLTMPAINLLRSCPRVISKKPINTEHSGISVADSVERVTRRASALIGLPAHAQVRETVMMG